MTAAYVGRVLSRLDRVRRSGDGWSALCPAHPDRNPSLSIGIGTEPNPEAVLIHCHRGCSSDAVCAALDLTRADLFPDSTRKGVEVVRRHVYFNAEGTALYAVDRVRFRGRSAWRYVHPDERGAWATKRGDARPVLYRLPALLANRDLPVWITEGERDADTLAAMQVVSTTVASGSWTGVDLSLLEDRRVFVVVDNDRAGWSRGRKALAAAQQAGALIEGIRRPGDICKDVTCWLAEGRGIGDLIAVDLDTEQPPCERWYDSDEPPPRVEKYADEKTGRDYFGMPTKRMLHEPLLSDLAVRLFGILDSKAGDTRLAKATATDIAKLLGRKDPRSITKAADELTEHGYITPSTKRGWWDIHNPVGRPANSGQWLV